MLVWPKRAQVDHAVRQWAAEVAAAKPELRRLGYFGSYARGDWGVGSDLDLVAVVAESPEPRERRAVPWDLTPIPVPADLLIYTAAEWEDIAARNSRFSRTLATEIVWVFSR